MTQTITIKEKSVYGKILLYPVCDNACLFACLIGAKTFALHDLNTIEQLGYKVEVIKLP